MSTIDALLKLEKRLLVVEEALKITPDPKDLLHPKAQTQHKHRQQKEKNHDRGHL